MINLSEELALLIFGKGDICVVSGYTPCLTVEDKKTAVVGFKRQTPREIGIGNGELKAGYYDDLALDVKMFFDNPKSVDMVIAALVEAKRYLTEEV